MATDTLRYPLDTTGVSVNNKVVGEPHDLVREQNLRVIAPRFGAIYKAGLSVVDSATGTPLTYGVQYYVAYRFDVPTARFKKNVCGLIVITDSTVNSVFLNYQAVGGDFSVSAQPIADMLSKRVANDRNEDWARILDPVDDLTEEDLLYYKGTVSDSAQLTMAINRLAAARIENDPAYMQQIKSYVAYHANKIGEDTGAAVEAQITDHVADLTAHPQYARIADINDAVPMVKQPVNVSPTDGALNISRLSFTMVTTGYFGLYEIPQNASQFQIAKDSAFTELVYDTLFPTANASGAFSGALDLGARYYWRCRYRNLETVWGEWSKPTSFITTSSGIATPAMTAPSNDATNIGQTPTLSTNAFAVVGGSDTHVSSDWQITSGPNGTGTVVFQSLNDATNKTSIAVPTGKLVVDTKYYVRARHNSGTLGASSWSNDTAFTTASVFLPVVLGTAYAGGYYGGTVHIGTKDYALILAPKATETSLALQSVTTALAAYDLLDATANTNKLYAAGNSPAANYVRGLTTGGYSDWQIPARGINDLLFNNLRPSIASLPAIFKTGGAEAFNTGTYWSSTMYDWTRDDSYNEEGAPIYGPVTDHQIFDKFVGPGQAVNCAAETATFGSPYSLSNKSVDANGWTSFTCSGNYTYQGIVGYQPGKRITVMTPMYEALFQAFADGSVPLYQPKTTSSRVRAVRLVDIATLGDTPPVGSPYQGGFYAGRIMEDGVLYDLVLAPKATGQTTLKHSLSDNSTLYARSVYDGAGNTASLIADNQPSGNYAKNATINGFTDWIVPARDELEVIYRNLKASIAANWVGERTKHNSDDPVEQVGYNQYSRPAGAAYSANVPLQTSVELFKLSAQEAFTGALYLSSTQNWDGGRCWVQNMNTGAQTLQLKSIDTLVRLIRKVKVAKPPLEIPSGVFGEAFAGGFYAGRFNDGFCNYALVVAPKLTGEKSSLILEDGASTAIAKMTSRIDGAYNTSVAAGTAAPWARALTIAGYRDWYIPSLDEVEILYRNLKPTADANAAKSGAFNGNTATGSANPSGADGINPNSIPAGARYTATNPAKTTAAGFFSTGANSLPTFVSSSTSVFFGTQYDDNGLVVGQQYRNIIQYMAPGSGSTSVVGNQQQISPSQPQIFRAVRRVPLDTPITEAAVADVPTVPGTPWAGGSYAGRVIVAGVLYALVVSPKAGGEKSLKWKTSATPDVGAYGDLVDGWKNTNQYNDALHPAAQWARSLVISGCNDWYLPARDELEVLYRYLKSTAAQNYTAIDRVDSKTSISTATNSHGSNDNSVPSGTRYLTTTPAVTTDPKFVYGATPGAQYIFSAAVCTSTVNTTNTVDGPVSTWIQGSNGRQFGLSFATDGVYRAIRRVKINS